VTYSTDDSRLAARIVNQRFELERKIAHAERIEAFTAALSQDWREGASICDVEAGPNGSPIYTERQP
jgi:hypothetical protein